MTKKNSNIKKDNLTSEAMKGGQPPIVTTEIAIKNIARKVIKEELAEQDKRAERYIGALTEEYQSRVDAVAEVVANAPRR